LLPPQEVERALSSECGRMKPDSFAVIHFAIQNLTNLPFEVFGPEAKKDFIGGDEFDTFDFQDLGIPISSTNLWQDSETVDLERDCKSL
jgi:hypothetical protein